MRSGLLLLVGLLLVSPCSGDEARKAPRAKGPRIVVEPGSFDFGEVLPNKTLRKEFLIRNHGSEALVIEKVTTDCGCTAALLDDTRIEPGDSAPLRVSLETRARNGPLKKRVLVQSNDLATRTYQITLTANVVSDKKDSE